jgi:hypothetical protein
VEPEARIEVEYQLEFAEFYRGLRWYAWRKCWWIYGCLIFIITWFMMTTIFRTDDPSSHPLMVFLPGLLIPIVLAALLYWGIYRNARKQFDSSSGLRASRHSVFSKEGVGGRLRLPRASLHGQFCTKSSRLQNLSYCLLQIRRLEYSQNALWEMRKRLELCAD